MATTTRGLACALLLLLLALGALPCLGQPATTRPARPNVVLVLLDDLGYGDLSCYDAAAPRTPNVDRLAREGVRFTQFYAAAPICSPARAAILTGQHPQRWRVTSYLDDRAANDRRGVAQWLDPAAPSLARELRRAGYATGHFGKWHLGGGRDVGDAPLPAAYGFDASLTQFEGLGDRLLCVLDRHDGSPPERPGLCLASARLGRGAIEWVDRALVTGRFADRAVAFADEARRTGKPFFVHVWPDDPHTPLLPPAGVDAQGKRARYRAVVESADAQLGRLFDRLRANPALRDNTVVILASDNGPEPGAGTAGPLRGHKTNLYEGGIRVPLIVWAPGLVAPGRAGATDAESVLAGIDLAPSILALAGVASDARFDGEAHADALLGRVAARRAGPLFWRRPPDRPGPAADPYPDLATRAGDWKLLCMRDGSHAQLYDLRADPGEHRDLAAEQPDRARALAASARAWDAALPADRPDAPRE